MSDEKAIIKPAKAKPAAKKEAAAPATAFMRVTVPLLNIRSKASLSSSVAGTLPLDAKIEVSNKPVNGFMKLADGRGYVKREFLADSES